jgi:hypothetical protein
MDQPHRAGERPGLHCYGDANRRSPLNKAQSALNEFGSSTLPISTMTNEEGVAPHYRLHMAVVRVATGVVGRRDSHRQNVTCYQKGRQVTWYKTYGPLIVST